MNYSPEQLEAITSTSPRLLIKAGAGSGKTEVMAARTRYFIDVCGINPAAIIAITFTVKAGRELERRIGRKLRHAGTIHALCLKECPKWHVWTGTPTIIDDEAEAKLILACATSLRLHKKVAIKAVGEAFTSGRSLDSQGEAGLVAKKVRREMLAQNQTSMDLLLHEGSKHLVNHLGPLGAVMWDEFQDSGPADMATLDSLAASRCVRFVTVVGDPSQSVYGFRGARVRNILALALEFATLTLADNYRSHLSIVTLANGLRHPEGVEMAAKRPPAEGPWTGSIRTFGNETQELGYLREQVQQLPPGHTLAILTRHNALAARVRGALADVLPPAKGQTFDPDHLRAAIQATLLGKRVAGAVGAYLAEFEGDTPADTLTALHEALAATEEDTLAAFGNITIGTVHSVKGLEFDQVIVAGCEAALWPGNKRGEVREEEQRLLYVAVTRARDHLTMTACEQRRNLWTGAMETSTLTPFLQ